MSTPNILDSQPIDALLRRRPSHTTCALFFFSASFHSIFFSLAYSSRYCQQISSRYCHKIEVSSSTLSSSHHINMTSGHGQSQASEEKSSIQLLFQQNLLEFLENADSPRWNASLNLFDSLAVSLSIRGKVLSLVLAITITTMVVTFRRRH